MLVGYTSGGTPILFRTGGGPRPARKRVLYRCSNGSCVHRATRNQAKASGGRCTHRQASLAGFKPPRPTQPAQEA